MDVQMPGMSGLEAIGALRAREAGGARRVPVVALTAQAMNGDAARCLEAGMDGYVSKPVDLVELERVTARAMSTAAAWPRSAGLGEPYDRAVLHRRVGSDPALLLELCEIFEARARVILSQVRGFIDGREPERLRAAAHELKGMLLSLAATDAGPIARDLEAAGQGARYGDASSCLARLAFEVPRLVSALRASAQPAAVEG
jgi:CheY-like chemotaxis protein